jgi:hypothetical protein
MTPRAAIALCLLLSLSGASPASGPSQSGNEAAEQNSGAADAAADPAAAKSEGQDTDGATDDTESDDQEAAPIDVHRHRPGACPEGPPCKGGE